MLSDEIKRIWETFKDLVNKTFIAYIYVQFEKEKVVEDYEFSSLGGLNDSTLPWESDIWFWICQVW